jgi:glycerol-3-phosphate acyltransferase PlsY
MEPLLSGASVLSGVAAFLFGYGCGSIPFGVILTRIAGAPDIRSIGSGNIGATNVLRTGRKALAAATLVCDAAKGTVPVAAVAAFGGPELSLLAGLGAFLGHLYPVWLSFKGGKGVAIYIGILIALAWPIAIAFCVIWLGTAALTRYSSLSALVASLATPPLLSVGGDINKAIFFAVLTVALWIKHRENIARLLRGTETRIGEKTASPSIE